MISVLFIVVVFFRLWFVEDVLGFLMGDFHFICYFSYEVFAEEAYEDEIGLYDDYVSCGGEEFY